MSLTFVGKIITEPEIIDAKTTGNKGYKFGFRTTGKKGETLNCSCWASANAGRYADIRLDAELTIRGFYGKAQKEMDGFNVVGETKDFVITYFRTKEQLEGARAIEIRKHGGEEGYRKYLQEYDELKRQAGLVRVKDMRPRSDGTYGSYYARIEDTVEVDGQWWYWGDFVYEQCPEEKRGQLTEGFRKFARSLGIFGTSDKRTAGTNNYHTWKQQLIERAQNLLKEKRREVLLPTEKTWEEKVAELNIV